ncbi:hypothetical protein [Blastomonas sp.]|uniref:hypothetical protein n=1 Tax=Blastomonas sp. TaxID=1909299 RepID=UPI00391A7998
MVDQSRTPANDHANDHVNEDAISDTMKDQTGKGGAGESGGGAYPNPHTGKEKNGGSDTPFEGGQSENRYFGPKDAQGNSAKHADRGGLASDANAEDG